MPLDSSRSDARERFAAWHIAYERGDDGALDQADDLVADDGIGPEDMALAYADVALAYARGEGLAQDDDKAKEYAFMALKVGVFDVLLTHAIRDHLDLRELLTDSMLPQAA